MDEARAMIEATDLAIDEIAERRGWHPTQHARLISANDSDTTPTIYGAPSAVRNSGVRTTGTVDD